MPERFGGILIRRRLRHDKKHEHDFTISFTLLQVWSGNFFTSNIHTSLVHPARQQHFNNHSRIIGFESQSTRPGRTDSTAIVFDVVLCV